MPLSEEAMGEGHEATYDYYVDSKGKRIARQALQVPRPEAQLSEIAHGEGDTDEKGFSHPEPQTPEHDFNPNS